VKSPRWFYVWLVPLMWTLISWANAYFPGDEYALSALGSIAGLWILFIVENTGSFWNIFWKVLVTGAVTMAIVGLVLDLLRAPRRLWAVGLVIAAIGICMFTITSYPSYQKAMSKHGSLPAYVFLSLNLGLYVSSALMLVVAPIARIWKRPYPPGHCRRCGYDLTGNVSGRCPECGTPTPLRSGSEVRERAGDDRRSPG
jgi:hypothetical protein